MIEVLGHLQNPGPLIASKVPTVSVYAILSALSCFLHKPIYSQNEENGDRKHPDLSYKFSFDVNSIHQFTLTNNSAICSLVYAFNKVYKLSWNSIVAQYSP